jgi:hypothetical protein
VDVAEAMRPMAKSATASVAPILTNPPPGRAA